MINIRDLRIGDWVFYNGTEWEVYGLSGPMPDKNERLNDKPTVTLWNNGLVTIPLEDITCIK